MESESDNCDSQWLWPLSLIISCPLWRLVVSAAVAGTGAETWTADIVAWVAALSWSHHDNSIPWRITLLSLRASVMFPRDTPSHSGPSVTNVTMLCLLRLLTLAGRKAVIRLSQDSDWAGSTLATALCISRGRAGGWGWPHIAVNSFLHFPNVNELILSPL